MYTHISLKMFYKHWQPRTSLMASSILTSKWLQLQAFCPYVFYGNFSLYILSIIIVTFFCILDFFLFLSQIVIIKKILLNHMNFDCWPSLKPYNFPPLTPMNFMWYHLNVYLQLPPS